MDPEKFSMLSFLYQIFPDVKLAKTRIVPNNIKSILDGFEVPKTFEILNLDIDSYDLLCLDELLIKGYKPKIISMEINEKIPPPIYFTVNYDEGHYWQADHFFGCSIQAACEVVKPHGYILESFHYNNAIFISNSTNAGMIKDSSAHEAYNQGYRNKPNRAKKFPWNSDVDCLLNMGLNEAIDFINQKFSSYKGKYTLRISK